LGEKRSAKPSLLTEKGRSRADETTKHTYSMQGKKRNEVLRGKWGRKTGSGSSKRRREEILTADRKCLKNRVKLAGRQGGTG